MIQKSLSARDKIYRHLSRRRNLIIEVKIRGTSSLFTDQDGLLLRYYFVGEYLKILTLPARAHIRRDALHHARSINKPLPGCLVPSRKLSKYSKPTVLSQRKRRVETRSPTSASDSRRYVDDNSVSLFLAAPHTG